MKKIAHQIYQSIIPTESRLWLHKLRHLKGYKKLRNTVHHTPVGDFSIKPFDEYQCIFIHITKSAGTSVAKGLFNCLTYHYRAVDYRVIYGKKTFNSYFKFAFVRNPWDRLYSSYRYLNSDGWNEEDRQWGKDNIGKFKNFNDFVKQWVSTNNIEKHMHFWPQHYFICDNKKNLLIDYLAYFETLDGDFNTISKKLNISSTIGLHNANPGEDYRDVYDDETRKIVAQVYATDIKLLGYDFDGICDRKLIN